jgi:signal transduction histidine kinase
LTPYRRLVPAMVGSLIALAAVGGFVATRSLTGGPSRSRLEGVATAAADTVSARLSADAELLLTASATIGAAPGGPVAPLQSELRRLAPSDRVLGYAAGSPDGAVPVRVALPDRAGSALVGSDLGARTEWRLALELARDRGGPGVAVGTEPDGGVVVLDALPIYDMDAVPADVPARRAALEGYVFTITPVSVIAGFPAASGSDVTIRVSDGDTVLAVQGRRADDPARSGTAVQLVTTGGVAWAVEASPSPAVSSTPWLVLLGGLVLALGVTTIVAHRERSMAAAVAETEARNQELALIARVGPLMQQSLALGDLLPMFVVEIGDELALDGIAVSLATDTGELVRAFSLGTGALAPLDRLDALGPPPSSVEAGDVVVMPLHRAGRVVGALQARAVRGLTPPQMNAFTAVCAVLAGAIGNVRLFQDEQQMVTRLRDVDRLKTSFIGSVSHELRTSVTAIDGFARLLEEDPTLDDATRADYLARISRNAGSLTVLVEDLLDFARLQRSGLTATLRPIDLSDLVPKVVEQMSSVLAARPVSTAIEPNVIAMADTLAVERVLANLLSNAGKYTPPDCEVMVQLERNTDHAVLSVIDRGPGVAADEREKIFELFYRSDQSARVTRGVGIGLALTRQLVDNLGGTITVDDAPGGGARFCVTIPLADDDDLESSSPSATEPTPGRSGG